jgi:hypothetical protein
MINESDWVGMRALYLLLATDTSAAQSPEVCRIMNFYRKKYGTNTFYPAMAAIAKDNGWRDTFNDPNVMFARILRKSIQQADPNFPEQLQSMELFK